MTGDYLDDVIYMHQKSCPRRKALRKLWTAMPALAEYAQGNENCCKKIKFRVCEAPKEFQDAYRKLAKLMEEMTP